MGRRPARNLLQRVMRKLARIEELQPLINEPAIEPHMSKAEVQQMLNRLYDEFACQIGWNPSQFIVREQTIDENLNKAWTKNLNNAAKFVREHSRELDTRKP